MVLQPYQIWQLLRGSTALGLRPSQDCLPDLDGDSDGSGDGLEKGCEDGPGGLGALLERFEGLLPGFELLLEAPRVLRIVHQVEALICCLQYCFALLPA